MMDNIVCSAVIVYVHVALQVHLQLLVIHVIPNPKQTAEDECWAFQASGISKTALPVPMPGTRPFPSLPLYPAFLMELTVILVLGTLI